MNKEEIKELERLLEKLLAHVNHRFCLIPGMVHDGHYIALYNNNGSPFIQESGPTLQSVIDKVIKKLE